MVFALVIDRATRNVRCYLHRQSRGLCEHRLLFLFPSDVNDNWAADMASSGRNFVSVAETSLLLLRVKIIRSSSNGWQVPT